MDQQILIEDEESVAMASELAALTGESLMAAVTQAVRERLQQQRLKQDRAQRLNQVLAMAAEVRAGLPEPIPTSDHSDLYDENGLPV